MEFLILKREEKHELLKARTWARKIEGRPSKSLRKGK